MAGPTQNIVLSGAGVDLSPRFQRNATVVASPAAAAETIIASLTVQGNLTSAGVMVFGWAAYTVGTDGTGVTLKLHKTDASGTTLKSTGILDLAATKLGAGMLFGFDGSPTLPGQVYVLTATVTLGSATSTVSAVEIAAIVL